MVKNSTIGGSTSTSNSATNKPQRSRTHAQFGRQSNLFQAPGNVRGSVAFLRERQRQADREIAHTFIECNLSFNVLRKEQWKKIVRAIANVGPCEDWTGVSYNDMRTKKIDEERERINKALNPICVAWSKVGCSILLGGWRD